MQVKPNPFATQMQPEEEEKLTQPKMDTTVTQRQEKEEMLQAKMEPTQFFVSEEEEEKKMPAQAKVAQKAEMKAEELIQGKINKKKSAPESDNAPTLGGTSTKMPEDVSG